MIHQVTNFADSRRGDMVIAQYTDEDIGGPQVLPHGWVLVEDAYSVFGGGQGLAYQFLDSSAPSLTYPTHMLWSVILRGVDRLHPLESSAVLGSGFVVSSVDSPDIHTSIKDCYVMTCMYWSNTFLASYLGYLAHAQGPFVNRQYGFGGLGTIVAAAWYDNLYVNTLGTLEPGDVGEYIGAVAEGAPDAFDPPTPYVSKARAALGVQPGYHWFGARDFNGASNQIAAAFRPENVDGPAGGDAYEDVLPVSTTSFTGSVVGGTGATAHDVLASGAGVPKYLTEAEFNGLTVSCGALEYGYNAWNRIYDLSATATYDDGGTETVRPQDFNAGIGITVGGTRDQVLADGSDATYIENDPYSEGDFTGGFADLQHANGRMIASFTVTARMAASGEHAVQDPHGHINSFTSVALSPGFDQFPIPLGTIYSHTSNLSRNRGDNNYIETPFSTGGSWTGTVANLTASHGREISHFYLIGRAMVLDNGGGISMDELYLTPTIAGIELAGQNSVPGSAEPVTIPLPPPMIGSDGEGLIAGQHMEVESGWARANGANLTVDEFNSMSVQARIIPSLAIVVRQIYQLRARVVYA